MATETTTETTTEADKYEGTFRWARRGEADVPCRLTRNQHGWFCDEINGQEWVYPDPTDPWGGWGVQAAKATPLEAVRGFLRQWNAFGSPRQIDPVDGEFGDEDIDPGAVSTAADRLTIRPVAEAR